MADDQYEGFHIPGDITVLPNIWYVADRIRRHAVQIHMFH